MLKNIVLNSIIHAVNVHTHNLYTFKQQLPEMDNPYMHVPLIQIHAKNYCVMPGYAADSMGITKHLL